MKLSLTIAVILAGTTLAACGSAATPHSTINTPTRTTRTITTPPQTSAAGRTALAIVVSGLPVNPCSLVTRTAVSTALAAGASAGHRAGPVCTYSVGRYHVEVTAYPVSAAFRAQFRRSVVVRQPGKTRVDEAGFQAIADEVTPTTPETGAPAEISFIKGHAFLSIVLTDAAQKKGSLVGTVISLARTVSKSR
jgi:hypothetical protein